MDLTAQMDDELSFMAGDIISVTQIVDSDFAIGLCHGKLGTGIHLINELIVMFLRSASHWLNFYKFPIIEILCSMLPGILPRVAVG